MKWSRFFAAGATFSVLSYVVESAFGAAFVDLYDPVSGLWRAMFTPTWTTNVLVSTILLAFVATGVYAICHTGLGKKAETTKKGLKFGAMLWLLRAFSGSVMTWVYMPISASLAGVWLLSGAITSILGGLLIAKIYK